MIQNIDTPPTYPNTFGAYKGLQKFLKIRFALFLISVANFFTLSTCRQSQSYLVKFSYTFIRFAITSLSSELNLNLDHPHLIITPSSIYTYHAHTTYVSLQSCSFQRTICVAESTTTGIHRRKIWNNVLSTGYSQYPKASTQANHMI